MLCALPLFSCKLARPGLMKLRKDTAAKQVCRGRPPPLVKERGLGEGVPDATPFKMEQRADVDVDAVGAVEVVDEAFVVPVEFVGPVVERA